MNPVAKAKPLSNLLRVLHGEGTPRSKVDFAESGIGIPLVPRGLEAKVSPL